MDGKAIPNGATLPTETTESAVDLDQLFNTFDPKTRKAAQAVIKGFADATDGKTKEANEATKYFNPRPVGVLAPVRRARPQRRRARALHRQVRAARHRRRRQARGRGRHRLELRQGVHRPRQPRHASWRTPIRRLPGFLRKSNTTFVNLRATLDDLDPLVDASKPVVRDLRPLLADLRPFARNARPTFRDLARTIRRPGAGNDLVELLRAQPRRRARPPPRRSRPTARCGPSTFDVADRRADRPARRRWPSSAPTRPTSPAGSTTSRPPASTTPTAPSRAPASRSAPSR